MGVLFDYFAAADDLRAAETIDIAGGPGEAGLPALSANGIDPVVQLGKLESLLAGREYDAVVANPRSGHPVAIRDGGEQLVLPVTDELLDALVDATPHQIEAVAEPWSRAEEFGGNATPAELAAFLHQLAGLARTAQENGDRLYCWVCV